MLNISNFLLLGGGASQNISAHIYVGMSDRVTQLHVQAWGVRTTIGVSGNVSTNIIILKQNQKYIKIASFIFRSFSTMKI